MIKLLRQCKCVQHIFVIFLKEKKETKCFEGQFSRADFTGLRQQGGAVVRAVPSQQQRPEAFQSGDGMLSPFLRDE